MTLLFSVLLFATAVAAIHHSHPLLSPGLPDFLSNNPLPHGFPWGLKTGDPSIPGNEAPTTGVTRRYNFTVTRQAINIDGFEKSGIVVNGRFPGPLIEANWGDWIEVTVNNDIQSPLEGTSMHWHGFTQRHTQWYDGTPGIGQCPIAPGSTFVYRFRADSYGTSWYHSHYSAQYADGAIGAIVIYGPNHQEYNIDLGPLLIGDYYHRGYLSPVAAAVGTNTNFSVYVPPSQNNYINGKTSYRYTCPSKSSTCASPKESFHELQHLKFMSGKRHRLRLINSGAAALQYFSIDNHQLEVISVDFVPLVPYNASFIGLAIGQRADVIVHGSGDCDGTYWMRATVATNCSVGAVNETKAIISYEDADPSSQPHTSPHYIPNVYCKNDDLDRTVPFFPMAADPNPSATKVVVLNFTTNSTGHHIWTQNNQTYSVDYNNPLLLLASDNKTPNNSHYDPLWLTYDFGSAETVRVVFNNAYQAFHPMHLHGYQMQVLAEGVGYWDGKTITNPQNPLRRDTHVLRRYGHLVIQITADNPGIWPFHCHIAWHLSAGLNMNLMTQPQKLREIEIPYVMNQTCVDWAAYTANHVVNQIDAGL